MLKKCVKQSDVELNLRVFYNYEDEIHVSGDLVLKSKRIIVPVSLRREILEKLHIISHEAIETLKLSRETVF